MPRKHRIQQDIYPYHITTRTNGRKLIFKKWTYKIIIKVLSEAVKKYNLHINHFKMMDNHYHLVATTPNSNISTIMWFINNQIAKRINKRMGKTGHLWGKRFFDTIVDYGDYALNVICYIYNNAVKAGLSKSASLDDRLSTFDFYAKGKKIGFIVADDQVFLSLGRDKHERQRNFIETVEQSINQRNMIEIKKGLRKMFYGSADFIQRLSSNYLK